MINSFATDLLVEGWAEEKVYWYQADSRKLHSTWNQKKKIPSALGNNTGAERKVLFEGMLSRLDSNSYKLGKLKKVNLENVKSIGPNIDKCSFLLS